MAALINHGFLIRYDYLINALMNNEGVTRDFFPPPFTDCYYSRISAKSFLHIRIPVQLQKRSISFLNAEAIFQRYYSSL